MNDFTLAAMHEQSEFAFFTDLRQPFKWITTDEVDWAIEYFNEHPDARAYGYVSF